MTHQIALNGKVHPDKNRDQLEKFIKQHKIAYLVPQDDVYGGATLDYLVSSSRDTETRLYKHVTEMKLPILNGEWMKEVVQAKQWVQPLAHHFISQGAASASTSQPAVEAAVPTAVPAVAPTVAPAAVPTAVPTVDPAAAPTVAPTVAPAVAPTVAPTVAPAAVPTAVPTVDPAAAPAVAPTVAPTVAPAAAPAVAPTVAPTVAPAAVPTAVPTVDPAAAPTVAPAAAGGTSDGTPAVSVKIEDADDDVIASAVREAKLNADSAIAAWNAAEDAYNKGDAEGVFDRQQEAYNAQCQVEHYKRALVAHFITSIANTNDIAAQLAYAKAESSVTSCLVEATKAFENANRLKTMIEVLGANRSRDAGTPSISDAETKRQKAMADAKAARDAANKAIVKANKLRQEADAKAEKAYAAQEAAKTKEGPEKETELERFREMSAELPEALFNANVAEQDAKKADELAVVRAGAAGISPQDLQQRQQSPWGDILGSSENSEHSTSSELIRMPGRAMGRPGAYGKIVCSLPRGQLVVTVPHLNHFRAYILPAKYAVERKAFKDGGGLQLEYEDADSYDDDDTLDIWDLDPVLVAVQTAKASKRTVLVILIANRRGSDDMLLYNLTLLKAIFPASQVAEYLNMVAAKQGQDAPCAVTQKSQKEDQSTRKREEWKALNRIP